MLYCNLSDGHVVHLGHMTMHIPDILPTPGGLGCTSDSVEYLAVTHLPNKMCLGNLQADARSNTICFSHPQVPLYIAEAMGQVPYLPVILSAFLLVQVSRQVTVVSPFCN